MRSKNTYSYFILLLMTVNNSKMSLDKPVRLDKKTHAKLVELAKKNGQSVGGCASKIIKDYVESQK